MTSCPDSPPSRRLRPVVAQAAILPALLLAIATASWTAPAPSSGRRCVVLVLPPGGWADLGPAVSGEVDSLMRQGAAGSMSCAVARPMSEAGAWVTLGAGNRAFWSDGFSLAEGLTPGGRERLARSLRDANSRLPYPIDIGSLGDTLHRAGLRTAALGVQETWQLAPAMDSAGRVDFVAADFSPAHLRQALAVAQFAVINGAAGSDLARADLLHVLTGALTTDQLLIVAALAPKKAPFVGLTPVVIRGAHFEGSLTSASTRRVGLIASIDLPPTILTYFGLPLPASYDNGALVRSAPRAFSSTDAIWFDAKSRQAEALRPLALPIFFGALLVLLSLSLLRRPRARESASPPLGTRNSELRTGHSEPETAVRARGPAGPQSVAMLALMCLPAASYVTVALPVTWPQGALVAAIVAVAVVVGVMAAALRTARAIALVSGLTLALLAIDMATGSRVQPVSLIGYTPGLGGRFYGVGNEVCGLIIAAGALVVGLWLVPSRRSLGVPPASPRRLPGPLPTLAAVALLAAVTVAMGHPALAANAGCVLVAVICYGALWAGRTQGRRAWLTGFAVCLGGLVLLLGLAALDAARGPEKMTHIGHAWVRLTSEGGSYLVEFARRRLASAWFGLTETPASAIVGVWVLFWTVALVKPLGFVRRACDGLPGARITLAAIALSGFAAAFLEDSTVAIPTMMLSLALPVLGLTRQEASLDAEKG